MGKLSQITLLPVLSLAIDKDVLGIFLAMFLLSLSINVRREAAGLKGCLQTPISLMGMLLVNLAAFGPAAASETDLLRCVKLLRKAIVATLL